MPLTENQKHKESVYEFKVLQMRVKATGAIIEYHSFGSMVCWDKDGNWYSFYDLEFVNPSDNRNTNGSNIYSGHKSTESKPSVLKKLFKW